MTSTSLLVGMSAPLRPAVHDDSRDPALPCFFDRSRCGSQSRSRVIKEERVGSRAREFTLIYLVNVGGLISSRYYRAFHNAK